MLQSSPLDPVGAPGHGGIAYFPTKLEAEADASHNKPMPAILEGTARKVDESYATPQAEK